MHLRSKWFSAVTAGAISAAFVALSQQPVQNPQSQPQNSDQEATFRADTRLVVLHASVVDKNGRLVTNLGQQAFRVYENGVEQPVKIFRREDVAVSMGLIIDNSASMRDKRRKVEGAAMALVKASNRQDEVFIVNFNDDAFLDQPFTGDQKKLEEALTRIDSRAGTAMRDALSMSIDYMTENAKKYKKVLLVVTDGDDNASTTTLERLLVKAQRAEAVVYAIGLLNDEDKRNARRAKRAIGALSEATGGIAYFPEGTEDVEKLALQVAHDIRNQYIIAYSPTNQQLDGSFRTIKVAVSGPNRPSVRTRSGYYARPEQQTPRRGSTPNAPGPNGSGVGATLR